MNSRIKPLALTLMLLGFCGSVQAAYFERLDYIGAGGYSAQTGVEFNSDAALDLSAPTGDVALFGANLYDSVLGNGSLQHTYAADAFMSFSSVSTDLWMSLSQSLSASSSGAMNVGSHQQDAFIDLSSVTLKLMGDAGEADGTAVQVSFAGQASALFDLSSWTSGGYLGLGMSVSRGDIVIGEYLWDVTQTGVQSVDFSFAAKVGEELSFSSFMLGGFGVENASFAQGNSLYTLAETGASLSGSFAMATAVPEPATYATLLAGLGMLGFVMRRRRKQD